MRRCLSVCLVCSFGSTFGSAQVRKSRKCIQENRNRKKLADTLHGLHNNTFAVSVAAFTDCIVAYLVGCWITLSKLSTENVPKIKQLSQPDWLSDWQNIDFGHYDRYGVVFHWMSVIISGGVCREHSPTEISALGLIHFSPLPSGRSWILFWQKWTQKRRRESHERNRSRANTLR